ncbi:hypothetical protein GFC29_243 [Anoxybacillus sp. B7M1]|jgi:Protein of unknown function (DUF3055)|uniref:DUF3055 domain-containing protein n=1 Tax=Anoxybacteroides rupiense TaxID=311460 RepID=A0ABD5IPZ8_9BACL|nr:MULTISPECIES: DUF3055 domain-containing protein [Anoxybacillus]ANB56313.1 hypothetical protein GFC28_1384 [Anoxybacillus sp. B2M1]ANB64490.1 hypothetical protein GFC29_243 [Anoxybacillus sp. B7M1]KXG10399.1 hypothetical protein AT864_00990 [Anoxybacillus sp. P3H1B]MBB3906316.1 hypothetical protein [Anoxybacillus rupiensis]MBS2770699.1 DUF3055 domain-containing protein [Anoxybacillus rupiensis]
MDLVDKLYDEHEQVKVQFVGFATKDTRYDFGIVYTNLFFGKPLVICMQTGRSALLDPRDVENHEYLQNIFRIDTASQTADLADFFSDLIPPAPLHPEYDY